MIDLEHELADALAAWRMRRTPVLAALVEEMSAMFEPLLAAIAGKTRALRHTDWVRRAQAQVASDLPALLVGVGSSTSGDTTTQLELLAEWPADPRMTGLAVRMLEKPMFATSSGNQKVWRRLFALVEIHGDPRAADALRALPINKIFRAGDRGQAMRDRAANVIAAIVRDHPVPPPSPDDARRATRIAEATADGRALLAQIRANPRDEQTRLVFMDWMLERGCRHALAQR